MATNRRKPATLPARRRALPRLPRLDWRGPAKRLAVASVAAALMAAIAVGVDRPVRQIVVDAPFQRVTAQQIEAAAAPLLLDAGVLSVDLEAVRRAVSSLQWVDRVRVRRHWPAAVRLVVTEQVPAARWGETGLLNTRGELFIREARHVPPELPRLSGPEGSEWDVAQRYLDARSALLPLGLTPVALTLNERGAWRLDLDTGLTVWFGRSEADKRMARFLDLVVPLLLSAPGKANYVDMRYSNGFAVEWRPPADTSVGQTGTSRGDDTDA